MSSQHGGDNEYMRSLDGHSGDSDLGGHHSPYTSNEGEEEVPGCDVDYSPLERLRGVHY
jgi:hypothetical protein